MVNYNMGRYYAWANLNKLIKTKLKSFRPGPTYEYRYIPPKSTTRHEYLPFEQWKGSNSTVL